MDPENRPVARELERRREEALLRRRQVEDEHDRRMRGQPPGLTADERETVTALSAGVPALWSAAATTAADREETPRCPIERVTVGVEDMTEYASVSIRWAGGFVSRHELVRPVRRYDQMRDFPQLMGRLEELRREGCGIPRMTARLNAVGFRPTKGSSSFDEEVVRQLLSRRGLGDERKRPGVLGPHRWWRTDLSRASGVRLAVLRAWVKGGWFHSRRSPVQGLWIVWADERELRRLGEYPPDDPFAHHPAEPIMPAERS